jgi:hypothetical protein
VRFSSRKPAWSTRRHLPPQEIRGSAWKGFSRVLGFWDQSA